MSYEDNKKFYAASISEYGVSAQGVHWNSKASQYKRFEAITKLLKKELSTSTIVDVGCGFAEYYNYLSINNRLPKKYIGLDCEEKMLKVSKKRFPDLEFYKSNILIDKLENEDYYICSGALNILNRKEFFLFITNCFNACKKGFIFNFLKADSYNYILVEEVITFVKNLNVEIKIKDNYLENDITIFLKK